MPENAEITFEQLNAETYRQLVGKTGKGGRVITRADVTESIEWTDRLFSGLSHSYSIDYQDDGNYATCIIGPGHVVTGFPCDSSDALQNAVVAAFMRAVASDALDFGLLLNSDESAIVNRVRGVTLEGRHAVSRLNALVSEWQVEDEEQDDADELATEQRETRSELQRLARFAGAVTRAGHASVATKLNELSRLAPDEIDVAEARAVLLAATGTLNEIGICF